MFAEERIHIDHLNVSQICKLLVSNRVSKTKVKALGSQYIEGVESYKRQVYNHVKKARTYEIFYRVATGSKQFKLFDEMTKEDKLKIVRYCNSDPKLKASQFAYKATLGEKVAKARKLLAKLQTKKTPEALELIAKLEAKGTTSKMSKQPKK